MMMMMIIQLPKLRTSLWCLSSCLISSAVIYLYNITICYLLIFFFFFAAELKHGGIPVEDFARHVKVLHLDGDYKFNQEFEVTINFT